MRFERVLRGGRAPLLAAIFVVIGAGLAFAHISPAVGHGTDSDGDGQSDGYYVYINIAPPEEIIEDIHFLYPASGTGSSTGWQPMTPPGSPSAWPVNTGTAKFNGKQHRYVTWKNANGLNPNAANNGNPFNLGFTHNGYAGNYVPVPVTVLVTKDANAGIPAGTGDPNTLSENPMSFQGPDNYPAPPAQ